MEGESGLPMGGEERKRLYKRLLLRGLLLAAGAAFLAWGMPRLLSLTAPFVVALVVAMVFNPVVDKLEQKLHIARRLSAFILTFFVVSALFLLLGWLVNAVVAESLSLASNINSVWGYVTNSIQYMDEKLDWLAGLLPFDGEEALEMLTGQLYAWLQAASKKLMDSALVLAANMTSKISGIAVASIVSLLAVYFTIEDYGRLSRYAKEHTERHIFDFFAKIKRAVQSAIGGYLRSQLLLALLAFAVMFVALVLYGQKYALLIALGLGLVDFLPIVGTIAVLVPWAVFELVAGEVQKSIFLLILGIGFFVLRKVVEPRIVGSQTGLHPLAALASIYAGMKISGVWGAILGPVVVMVAVNIFKSGIFDDAVADLKDLVRVGRCMLKR